MNKSCIKPDMKTILAHHDVVFRAPVCDPTYGIPLGNGSMGALLWPDEDTLHIQINHTDLIDDIETDPVFCAAADEKNTVCRNGAQVNLNFHCPIFGGLYQKEYEARLNLHDAEAEIHADCAFGQARITAFCSEQYNTLIVRVAADWKEPLPVTCDLRRWGSRTFMYWYGSLSDAPDSGLDGTEAHAEDGTISVTQSLHGCAFCVMASVLSDPLPVSRAFGSHGAEMRLGEACQQSVVYCVTIGIGETPEEAERKAREQIGRAAASGCESILCAHRTAWASFWSRSYVSLPEDQDFAENLWYLNLYYANCEMKGELPPHFCNGIWGFYHDFVPWNCYFHYNAQLGTFPLEAAGHPELTETYYRFRRNQLSIAEAYARKVWNLPGAFYADVCDMKGRMSENVKYNCTCGAQIALGMVRHYRYTGDTDFLREKALPLLKAAGEFYLGMLKRGEDGFLHIRGTQGYEGSPMLDDSITDHAMIRVLFSTLAELLPEEEGRPWRECLNKLAPFMTADFLEEELNENGMICKGIGKGRKPLSPSVLSVGIDENGRRIRKTFGNPENDYYGFPDTEMVPLFPAGIVGLADRESELFRMIENSVLLHHHVRLRDLKEGEKPESCMGWCMMPIYLARLGEAELLAEQLKETISGWITFPQGFGSYTPTDVTGGILTDRFKQYEVSCGAGKTKVPAWHFRHFDYETLPIIATAVNEMLLQSHDGILRLFPAVRKDTSCSFRLYAEGGFIVDAVYDRGAFTAAVESTRGGKLMIAFDNVAGIPSAVREDGTPAALCEGSIYETDTIPGRILRFSAGTLTSPGKTYSQNRDLKTCGCAKLGAEKEF